jgi:hypothetical protein
MVQVNDLSKEINKHVPSTCQFCVDTELIDWPFQPKKAYFISMVHFCEIKIKIKTCPKCKLAHYPDMYNNGLFPLHNKLMLSYDLLMDVYNLLVTGSSLVENIEEKIILIGKCNGYAEESLRINLSNNAKNIEKIAIATISALGKLLYQNIHSQF